MSRIERILDSGHKAVFVAAGGGESALNAILKVPGASGFIADARVPYSPQAMESYLGCVPAQSVSQETARKMARLAYEQSAGYLEPDCAEIPVGISCTAGLMTDRERRGADRAFVCIKTESVEKTYSLFFSKSSRTEQEALLSDWILVLISEAVGVEPMLILPGSFNPVHFGHTGLLKAAEKMIGRRGVFELSSQNVDKRDISEEEMLRRLATITDIPVALTCAPRFVQKAALFPGAVFVLGYDTAVRLVEYAENGEWQSFRGFGTRFLVAGRAGDESDRFMTLEELHIPRELNDLFQSVSEEQFRADISSTELRSDRGYSLPRKKQMM